MFKYLPRLPALRLGAIVLTALTGLVAAALTMAAMETAQVSTEAPTSAPLKVVATIRPLALLVQDVGGEVVVVETLLPTGASPHHYSLRVSDMRRLKASELLVWVGPEFEGFLAKTVTGESNVQVQVAQLPDLHWPAPAQAHHHAGETDEVHGRDMHLWLDPHNGIQIIDALVEQLAKLAPQHQAVFAANARQVKTQIEALMEALREDLAPLAHRPFGVSHDGFGHFVHRFGLHQVAALTTQADAKPGARQVAALKRQLDGARCLLVEQSESGDAAQRWQHLYGLPVVVADPLAVGPHLDTYATFVAALGASFTECLATPLATSG